MNRKSLENEEDEKDIKDDLKEIQDKSLENLSKEVAVLIVGAKTLGHMIKKTPSAIMKRKKVKEKGEIPEGVLDYIEGPDFEWDEEKERVSQNIYEKIKNPTNLLNEIKRLYEVIRNKIKNRKIKKLPEGEGEEKISKTNKNEGKKEFIEGLSKNVLTMEEQSKNSQDIMKTFVKNGFVKNNEEKEL